MFCSQHYQSILSVSQVSPLGNMKERRIMAEQCFNDDMFPATQPVLPLLLKDVIAYVEVRSGHDNRSVGVQTELRTLGARVELSLSNEVTHVVFQGGLVSTYRKARKMMCHVVSVSWIEASKNLGHKAPEEEYPPPGVEKYEDPDAARKIKVLKSMQPDFDEEKERERLNAILSKIKKKKLEPTDSEGVVSSVSKKPDCRQRNPAANGKRKSGNGSGRRRSTASTDISTTLTSEDTASDLNERRYQRKISSVSREPKSITQSENPPKRAKRDTISRTNAPTLREYYTKAPLYSTTEGVDSQSSNPTEGYRTNLSSLPTPEPAQPDSSQLRTMESRPFQSKLSLQRASGDTNALELNNFAVPAVNPKTGTGKFKMSHPATKPIGIDLRNSSSSNLPTCLGSGSENARNEVETVNGDRKMREKTAHPLPSCESKSTTTRALVSIENVINKTGKKSGRFDSEGKSSPRCPEPKTLLRRSTRRSTAGLNEILSVPFLDPSHKHHTASSIKKFKLALTEGNPFVNCVLKSLSTKTSTVLHPKSPWRRVERSENKSGTCLKRQSPRLNPDKEQIEEVSLKSNVTHSDSEDSEDSLRAQWGSPQRKPAVPLERRLVNDRASAHLLRLWKAKTHTLQSTERDSFDNSLTRQMKITSPMNLYKERDRPEEVPSLQEFDPKEERRQNMSVENEENAVWPSSASEPSENERSESPVLGTSVKRSMLKSFLKANVSPRSSRGVSGRVSPIQPEEKSQIEQASSSGLVGCPVNIEEMAQLEQIAQQTAHEFVEVDGDVCLSAKAPVGFSESSKTKGDENRSSTKRTTRRNSRPRQFYLVCTHMKSSELKEVEKAVKDFGSFLVEEQVTSRTTHLVASGPRRTINMLRALSRGCWILKADWVFESRKAGKWLNESDFELTEFSPLVKQRRLERLGSDDIAQWDLFSSVGRIFVSPTSQPSPSDLKELILLNGGSVTSSAKDADLIVGPPVKKTSKAVDKKRILPLWILDCLTKGELLTMSNPCYMA